MIRSDLASLKDVVLPLNVAYFPDQTVSFLKEYTIIPDFINKSQEGSLVIEFEVDGKYHMVEFWPDGDIVLLKRNRDSTDAWDLKWDSYVQTFKSEVLPD